jgi:hypothetical protein
LFAYLRYAERLERAYSDERSRRTSNQEAARCTVLATKSPSVLAQALGNHLKDVHATSSWVHWGNEGFAVDAALIHPERPDDVTIGVLCDGSRFAKAADRVQWDIFRSEVLQTQHWRLLRLWSPELFRNPAAAVTRIKNAVQEWLAGEAATKKAAEPEKRVDAHLLN